MAASAGRSTLNALMLALTAVLLAASTIHGRPIEDGMVEGDGASARRLLSSNCGGSQPCTPAAPDCNYYNPAAYCYFSSKAMALQPPITTSYWCGPGCGVWRGGHTVSQTMCPTVTCGQTIGAVAASNGGCASAYAYVNSQASSQVKDLYTTVDGDFFATAFATFCSSTTALQLEAVAGVIAERAANATALTQITACQTACACCDKPGYTTSVMGSFSSATATAVVNSIADALVRVFSSESCSDFTLAGQASGFAQSTAVSIQSVTDKFFNDLKISKQSTEPGAKQMYNRVCKDFNYDELKKVYAYAYSCAITSVLSKAFDITDPNIWNPSVEQTTNTTAIAKQCSVEYSIAYTSLTQPPLPPNSCAGKCSCPPGWSFQDDIQAGGVIKTCQPSSTPSPTS